MFNFIVRYFGFLRHVPLLPHLFNLFLLSVSLITKPWLVRMLDRIERTIGSWEGVTVGLHKYGGIEFRRNGREIGHVHANGIVDILFSKSERDALVSDHVTGPHHIYPDSGWTTFYIHTPADEAHVLDLFQRSFIARM
jgi:hypothetical protein